MSGNFLVEVLIFVFAVYGLSVLVLDIFYAYKTRKDLQPKLNVILRVLNQEEVIEGVIRKILRLKWQVGEFRLMVIDGGSIDDTISILERLRNKEGFELLQEGKRVSPLEIIQASPGQIICYLDLEKDLELLNNPEQIGKILKGIA